MAETTKGSGGGARRKATTPAPDPTTPETTAAAGASSAASNGSTRGSSDSTSNPLGLERDTWTAPEGELPADVGGVDDYVPPAPELLEWTPERAGAIVRVGGFLLHTADPIARDEVAKELEIDLWRATEDDVSAIAPPLARILNRYAPARRLAGVSDEMELAFGMIGYLRENMADRGRIVTVKRRRETEPDEPPAGGAGTTFGGMP